MSDRPCKPCSTSWRSADVRPRRTWYRRGLFRILFLLPLRDGEGLMSAADAFGLVMSIAVLAYLVYALFRGERL